MKFFEALVEDGRIAGSQLVFSTIGGSAWTPRALRRWIFQVAGADLGSPPGVRFRFGGKPRNLSFGTGIFMNEGVFIEATASVVIGDDCDFGMDSMILTSHHPMDGSGHVSRLPEGCPVTIGDRVWVGARAVILPGAVIESDVIIGAGAVVRGHCQARNMYAGVPARRVREVKEIPPDIDNHGELPRRSNLAARQPALRIGARRRTFGHRRG